MTPPNRSSKHAKVPANPLWHTLATDQTEEALRTGPQGLSETEARERPEQKDRLLDAARKVATATSNMIEATRVGLFLGTCKL